ncbi:DUF2780 domain-containing protein [Lelliottia jeotgali]
MRACPMRGPEQTPEHSVECLVSPAIPAHEVPPNGGLGELLGENSESQSALSNALGNNVENRNYLDAAFKALRMDTAMIGQFAPLILQYLGQ